jgi:excisionase family DNA binding protein
MTPMKPKPQSGDPELAGTLSLTQLARRWNTSPRRIRRLLGQQQLSFVQIRGSFRVPLAEVERYEKSGQKPP